MKILIESQNNHQVEDFGQNTLTFSVESETVLIRATIEGKDYEIDFDLDIEEFEQLVDMIRIQSKHLNNK